MSGEPNTPVEPVSEKKVPKKVIIAIPGKEFSNSFLVSWTETVIRLCRQSDYEFAICPGYSSFVTFARMQTLGLDSRRGVDQKPFGGADFDYFVSIDSDMVFDYNRFMALVKALDEDPVVSGSYTMANGKSVVAVREWNDEYFIKHGHFEFIGVDDFKYLVEQKKTRVDVAYVGMGFFGCRREVFDKISYPFFWHDLIEIKSKDGKTIREIPSEDVCFCRNLTEAGIPVTLRTDIVVGHEKNVVL